MILDRIDIENYKMTDENFKTVLAFEGLVRLCESKRSPCEDNINVCYVSVTNKIGDEVLFEMASKSLEIKFKKKTISEITVLGQLRKFREAYLSRSALLLSNNKNGFHAYDCNMN